jgi:hypothetical protein
MACFRIECDVEMLGDWRVTNDKTILLGNGEDGEVGFTCTFRDRELLRRFAHDINKMVGLKDDYDSALFPVEEENGALQVPPTHPNHHPPELQPLKLTPKPPQALTTLTSPASTATCLLRLHSSKSSPKRVPFQKNRLTP